MFLSHGSGEDKRKPTSNQIVPRLQPITGKGQQRHCQPKQPRLTTGVASTRPHHNRRPLPVRLAGLRNSSSRTPQFVLPDPDPVPTAGRGWWARPLSRSRVRASLVGAHGGWARAGRGVCEPPPIRLAGPRSGIHGGARVVGTPTIAFTRTGVSCGRPWGLGAGQGAASANHPIRLAGPGSGTHGGARVVRTPAIAFTRTGVSCGRPWGLGAGRARRLRTTPLRLTGPRSGTHASSDGRPTPPRLPRLRSGATPYLVVPDSDPVPTVGRGWWARQLSHSRVRASLVGAHGGWARAGRGVCEPPPFVLPDPDPVPTVGRGTGRGACKPAQRHPAPQNCRSERSRRTSLPSRHVPHAPTSPAIRYSHHARTATKTPPHP